MPIEVCRRPRAGLVFWTAAALWALAGCSSFNSASQRLANVVTPYRADVVQGNFVSREQVEALQAGMSRQQVREILGTPLVTSLFHADRWDYAFSIRRQGVEPQQFRLTLYFTKDVLSSIESDELPSETEFVERLSTTRATGKVPTLEATEEQLQKFPVGRNSQPQPTAPQAPLPANYPPLESAPR